MVIKVAVWLTINASAPFTPQAAQEAIDEGEVKVYKQADGRTFYVMESIEIERTKKCKKLVSVSDAKNGVKLSSKFIEKMLEDDARRKHSGIVS